MLALILAVALADVERFVKTPVADMTPDYIQAMLAVDEKTLSPKLRERFVAKRLELHVYRQMAEGQKRGTIRMPDSDCSIPLQAKADNIAMLKQLSFMEITEDEVHYLEESTKCSQIKMMCEFTLQIVHKKVGKRVETHYFIHPKDALAALVSEFRTKGRNTDTPFFGRSPFPQCS